LHDLVKLQDMARPSKLVLTLPQTRAEQVFAFFAGHGNLRVSLQQRSKTWYVM